jgi:hypothetical protein
VQDKLQSVLWCVHQIITMRQIRKPRIPEGLIVAELNAYVELHLILNLVPKGGVR